MGGGERDSGGWKWELGEGGVGRRGRRSGEEGEEGEEGETMYTIMSAFGLCFSTLTDSVDIYLQFVCAD